MKACVPLYCSLLQHTGCSIFWLAASVRLLSLRTLFAYSTPYCRHCFLSSVSPKIQVCRTVHDDVYKIIKYSIQKSMSGEVAQRALDWWAGLVEHLFGLPVRTPEQEKAVVPAAEDHSNRQKVMHADLALFGDDACPSTANASPALLSCRHQCCHEMRDRLQFSSSTCACYLSSFTPLSLCIVTMEPNLAGGLPLILKLRYSLHVRFCRQKRQPHLRVGLSWTGQKVVTQTP